MVTPLLQDILLAAGLLSALALFLSLKGELRATAGKHRKQIEELDARIQAPADPPELVYVPAAPRSGMNLNKRAQALRMLRRNEDASHIAAALCVPRSEVELLIRIQRITAPAASQA